MKILRFFFTVALFVSLSFFMTACGFKEKHSNLSTSQQEEVRQILKDYLLSHPEILIDMSQKLRENMAQKQSVTAKTFIKSNASKILSDSSSPQVGQSTGKVALVEFFDYQCVYCAEMYSTVKKMLQIHPDLKVIFKEYPIFGAASEYAASAALAAAKQGKYIEMHNALFDSGYIEGKMSNDKVDAIAKKIGLNLDRLKKDIKASDIQDELKAVRALAQGLSIQGTPAFIILPAEVKENIDDSKITFIPGKTSESALQEAIKNAS